MKRFYLSLLGVVAVLAPGFAFGQSDSWHNRQDVNYLRKRAAAFDVAAIYELGLRRDTASLSLLRKLADNPGITESDIRGITVHRTTDTVTQRGRREAYEERVLSIPHPAASYAARAVLTKWKAADYFGDFVKNISTGGDWQGVSIVALGYIGDPRAIKYIGPLLLSDECKSGADLPCETLSSLAAPAMGRLIQPSFITDNPDVEPGNLIAEWQHWWLENRAQYGDTTPVSTKRVMDIENERKRMWQGIKSTQASLHKNSSPAPGVQIQSEETQPYSILIDSGAIPATVGAFKLVTPATAIKMPTVDVLMIFDPKSGLLWWSYQLDKSNNVSDLIQNLMNSSKLFLANGNLYAFRSAGNSLMVSESTNRYKTQELAVNSIIPIIQQQIAANNSAPVLPTPTQNVDLWKVLGQSFFMVGSRVSSATLNSLSHTNKQWIIGMTGPNKDSAIVTLSGDYKAVSASLNGKAVYP